MGEYQALSRLDPATATHVVPLFEIPPSGYDFETKQAKKSPAEHLKDFGKRLCSKWDSRPCFLDLKYFDSTTKIGSAHYVDFIFEQVDDHGCSAVPVVTFKSDAAFIKAVSKIQNVAEIGICIRLSNIDFDDSHLAEKIKKIGVGTGVGWGATDIVFDLGTPSYIPKTVFRGGVSTMLAAVPQLNKARSIIIAGTSYPRTLQDHKDKEQSIPRSEWSGYKDFISHLDESARIPTFGDYATAHTDLVELDMRFITPYAKLRYTIDDAWYLAIGKAVRTEGFEQYRDMCKTLVKRPFFDGPDYSAADAYIHQCAKGTAPTGNLSTWVWVATNRHITKTVADLASFHELSG
jgi:hypothetical protein